MPISLHASFVPSGLQMIGTANHLVDKTESWCGQQGCDASTILNARLIDDMLPFTYQIKCVAEHTAGALAAVKEGVYSPDLNPPPGSFDGLREKLAGAKAALEALSEDEMESWIGRDMRFEFKTTRMDFTVEDFLLSFSQPNFYFHASAAYSIARHLGVSIGKTDFLGRMRIAKA
ncbi:hypothetical protein EH31_13150 [Erythrobacter longus]|uniref:DUF1993 domain-containing protein n=1 Tax=Erythrobacter longus TaxID=1044 RepID=A0A074M6I7_ERYLO|nr:DUF1993 domain-containing protein [Erythrobacter longus]KEO88989.1 hypothetical protein EH31_13150 [Erythrobacter longus]